MEAYDPKKRYCGPGKGVITWLVPEKPLGVCINECCYKHDEAYEKGGTGTERLRADKVFRMSIRIKLTGHRWIPLFLASWIAQRYFKAVRILGSACFNYRAVVDERFVKLVAAAKMIDTMFVGGRWCTSQPQTERFRSALRSAEQALAEVEQTGA